MISKTLAISLGIVAASLLASWILNATLVQGQANPSIIKAVLTVRHAYDDEIPPNGYVTLSPEMFAKDPSLVVAKNGADSRWKTIVDFCSKISVNPLCGGLQQRPVDDTEEITISPGQVNTILNTISFAYSYESPLDDGTLMKFYQSIVEFQGEHYVITLRYVSSS